MLRKLLIATIAVVFAWLAALPAALAQEPQRFAIEGQDASGRFSGQLTLTQRTDGSIQAERTATYDEGGETVVVRGTLTKNGDALEGTLAPLAGVTGALRGDRGQPAQVSITVSPDGQSCRGSADGGSFAGKTFASTAGLLQFLNDAHSTPDQLSQAAGISPWRAKRILEAGQKTAFANLGDVDAVPGVGAITLEKLEQLVDPAGAAAREARILAFLNDADSTAKQLRKASRIGPLRAKQIMSSGPYADLDEVEALRGIGPVTLQQLLDMDFSVLGDDAGPALPPIAPDPALPAHTPSGESFAGYTIYDFDPAKALTDTDAAYRIAVDWNTTDEFIPRLEALLAHPKIGKVKALVIGHDGGEDKLGRAAELLVQNAARLRGVEALFWGDIDYEEAEISWIMNTDIGPLVQALPKLRVLKARGGNDLRFSGGFTHEALEEITVESGATSNAALRDLAALSLPNARSVEIWIGTEEYGASGDAAAVVAALQPFLTGAKLPKLEVLGLMNSDHTDAIAAAVANAPILRQLKTLDLSMGTLGDDGAAHLLASDAIKQLQILHLNHHYMTDAVAGQLANLSPVQVNVDASNLDPQYPDDRYVAVGE